jgi:hypothetical protein
MIGHEQMFSSVLIETTYKVVTSAGSTDEPL